MIRLKTVQCVSAALAIAAVGCHSAPPAQPAAPARSSVNTDSIARAAAARAEAARRDSISRADAARRDAAARAEADQRARDAAAAAAKSALDSKIFFDYQHDELRSEALATLDAKVPVLRTYPSLRIRIEGNADDRGSDEYNIALGQRRSAAAKRYLVSRGIDDSRIDIVSFGEEHPTCHDESESCWHQNRRDEFSIVAGNTSLGTARQ
jgi:peptidoglycan-associated lipoprotein